MDEVREGICAINCDAALDVRAVYGPVRVNMRSRVSIRVRAT